jgi:hypothetical protein
MLEVRIDFIRGMCVGLEWPVTQEIPTVNWAFTLDLFIIRISLVSWMEEQ